MNNNPFPKERAYLSELGKVIKDFFGFQNEAIVVSNACVSGIISCCRGKTIILIKVHYDHVFIVSGDVVTQFILSGLIRFKH